MSNKRSKSEIRRMLVELRKEKQKYKWPEKEYMRIHAKIAAFEKMLKPNYTKLQSEARKGKKKPVEK